MERKGVNKIWMKRREAERETKSEVKRVLTYLDGLS